MPTDNNEPVLADDQKLEWADTPLRAEDRNLVEEEEADDTTDEDETTDDTETDSEEPDDNEETTDDTEEEEELDAPVLTVSTEDPGEYTPKDYSFDITVEGKVTKITTPEQAAEFADANAENLTAPELLKFMRSANKMENSLERDREDYDSKKAKFDADTESVEAQQTQINNVANEINYLVAKGKLPKADAKWNNADWSDPEVAKQDGVKEQVELLSFMRKENAVRAKAGLPPMTSALDAYNALQLEKGTDDDDGEKQANTARKKAGSKVSAPTAKPVNIAPKGVAVGRAFNLNDLDSL